MVPVDFPGSNVTYSAPLDWDAEKNGPCEDLKVLKAEGSITSCWVPSPEELKMLNEGGFVMLVIMGNNLPPVMLATCEFKNANRVE